MSVVFEVCFFFCVCLEWYSRVVGGWVWLGLLKNCIMGIGESRNMD